MVLFLGIVALLVMTLLLGIVAPTIIRSDTNGLIAFVCLFFEKGGGGVER
jgi:hypothetical protein